MKLLALWLALALSAQEAQEAQQPQPEFEPIFDGLTLDGWVQRGGDAQYEVRDGAIVGNAVAGGPNSFLCTELSYGDFELELEFSVRGNLNSGVQIRSQARSEARNAVVYGYQVEIDPSAARLDRRPVRRVRPWLVGRFGGRRGGARSLSCRGMEPHARAGSRQPSTHLDQRRPGHGLHRLTFARGLHRFASARCDGGGRWTQRGRGARCACAISAATAGKPFGMARTWPAGRPSAAVTGSWKASRLVGTSPATQQSHGVLLSESRYGDFTARLSWRIVQGNSGFYFRCEPVEKDPLIVHGLQAEIDGGEQAGGLYETGGREWVVAPDPALVAEHYRAEDWNETIVYALGSRLAVDLNGWRSAELAGDPGRSEGHFGLQLHGGQAMRLELRSIEVLLPVAR